MIEDAMERIAKALERIAHSLQERSPAESPKQPANTKPEKPANTKPEKPANTKVEEDGRPYEFDADLKPAFRAIAEKDPEAARKLLTACGVERLSHLKPEQYADFMQKAKAAK